MSISHTEASDEFDEVIDDDVVASRLASNAQEAHYAYYVEARQAWLDAKERGNPSETTERLTAMTRAWKRSQQ